MTAGKMTLISILVLVDTTNQGGAVSKDHGLTIPAGTVLTFENEIPANVERLVKIGVMKLADADQVDGTPKDPAKDQDPKDPAAPPSSDLQDAALAILANNAEKSVEAITADMGTEMLQVLLAAEQSGKNRKTVQEHIQKLLA